MNALRLIVIFILCSCDHSDDAPSLTSNHVNDFIWKGLNSWYYWQDEVPILEDQIGTQVSYISLLNETPNPSDFFYSVLNDYPNTDRFSWIVDDYPALLNSFQGTQTSLGFELGLARIEEGSEALFGYVKYVIPGSMADLEGLERGHFFTKVNGVTLTVENYINLIYGNAQFDLELANWEDGMFVNTGIVKHITQETLSENPVYYTNVYGQAGNKVGYLVYNSFTYTYHQALWDAFTYFQSEQVNDLIVDLRYNGGGSARTATYLASMIAGSQNEAVFSQLTFNQKHQDSNRAYLFTNEIQVFDTQGNETGTVSIPNININSVTFLTSYSSASASEMLINGLKPYLTVSQIGTTTRGKNVGSITLFDSPIYDFTSQSEANKEHTYAMQPIVFQVADAQGNSNYAQGIPPTIEINELDYLDGFLPFGNMEETLLSAALAEYGIGRTGELIMENKPFSAISISPKLDPLQEEMYLLPGE